MKIRYDQKKLEFLMHEIDDFVSRSEPPLLAYLERLGVDQYFRPSTMKGFFQDVRKLHERLTKSLADGNGKDTWTEEIDERDASLLRRIIQDSRLERGRDVEKRSAKTFDAEVLDLIESELEPYTKVMEEDWFKKAENIGVPRLTDFAPLEVVEKEYAEAEPVERRTYDEKFHILQAPTLFIPDLEAYRKAGRMREINFAVAFIDIDDFKTFNQAYTETIVDRELLPLLMRSIEAHLYKRGYAYRFGGDEYLVLLYNTPREEAIRFLDDLRVKIEGLRYRQIDKKVTVSIGLICADGDCYFTSRELEAKASKAKAFAKLNNGKNCIATYQTAALKEADLRIVAGATGIGGSGGA